MELDGKDGNPSTAPVSTIDGGMGESSYNKTIDDGPGSTCEDGATDWKRWISVESTVDGTGVDSDWQGSASGSAADATDLADDCMNGRPWDPDGTFVWNPQSTRAPEPESTVWPLGSSLFTSAVGRREAVAGFQILSELGCGGMGIVYKARHLRLKRLVALKVIRRDRSRSPEDLARLEIEAEVVARLNHPNILRIYDIGTADGVPFVALELLEGGTLKERLAGNPQPVRDSAELVATLARAVHAAHLAGVLHRDLKPSNVLFDRDGVPKIADFGLAKRLDVEEGETLTGQVIGTPSYMAPEQAHGWDKEIGATADVYSLGAILYEMLTGRPPIKGTSQTDTLKLIREEEPVAPSRLRPKLPIDLETICLKCIARDPRKRYADAQALAEDLDRFLFGAPVRARRTPVWERALKLVQRHPLITAVLSTVLVASGVGSGVALQAHRQAQKLESDRISGVLQTAKNGVSEAQLALAENRWNDVRPIVSVVITKTEKESDGRLIVLREQAKSLGQQAERKSSEDAEKRRAEAQADQVRFTLRDFRKHLDEARFLDTRFDGLTPANSLELTCRHARGGLGVFANGAGCDKWTLEELPQELTPQEQAEVTDGFYELLLILADAVSQSPQAEPVERVERALHIIDRARVVRSQPTKAFHLRRSAYLEMKDDRQGAAQERAEAGRIAPVDAFDFFLIGRDLFRKKDLKAAVTSFDAATQRQPDHFWAKCLLAICHLQMKEPSKARLGLNACLQQKPDRVWLYLLRGIANAAEGKVARDLAQLYPDPSASLSTKASEYFEAALADYREAFARIGNAPADADLQYVLLVNRGHIQLERQDLNAAALDLNEAVHANSQRFEAYSGLAHVYQRQGKTEKALEQLATAIRLQPKLPKLHRARADLILGLSSSFLDLRDVDLRDLEDEVHDLAPDLRDLVHSDLEVAIRSEQPGTPSIAFDKTKQAVLFHVAGRHKEALEACSAALEIAPRLAFTHQLRINVLLDLKQYDDLIRSCDLALSSVRPSAALYELRGMAKDGLEDYSGAIADYTMSLSLQPENPRVRRRRGWSYFADDSTRPACDDFEVAIRLAPDNADAYSGRGLAKARLGWHEEAVSDARTSLRLDEKSWRIAYNAARIYAQAAVAADAESRKTGPAAVRVVTQYLERAVDLARLALERAPAEQRSVLLRETMMADPALKPIWRRLKSL